MVQTNQARAAIRYLLENPFSDFQMQLEEFQLHRRQQYQAHLKSNDGMAGLLFSVEALLFSLLTFGFTIVVVRNTNKFGRLIGAVLYLEQEDLDSPAGDTIRFTQLLEFRSKEAVRLEDMEEQKSSEIERQHSFFGSFVDKVEMEGGSTPALNYNERQSESKQAAQTQVKDVTDKPQSELRAGDNRHLQVSFVADKAPDRVRISVHPVAGSETVK